MDAIATTLITLGMLLLFWKIGEVLIGIRWLTRLPVLGIPDDTDSPGQTREQPPFVFWRWAEQRGAFARMVANRLFRTPTLVVGESIWILCFGTRSEPTLVFFACCVMTVLVSLTLVNTLIARLIGPRYHLDPDSYAGFGWNSIPARVGPTGTTALQPVIIIGGYGVCVILTYAALYLSISLSDSSAFHRDPPTTMGALDAIYFSVVTLATIGYGDIYRLFAKPWDGPLTWPAHRMS